MSEVKDNHYVPRFHLRNFTLDPGSKNGSFDLYSIKGQKHVGVVPHGSQLKERYFYERGSDTEKMLDEKFERTHASLVRQLLQSGSKPEEALLQEVMLLMHFRTRAQRDEDLEFRKHIIDHTLEMRTASFRAYLEKEVPSLTGYYSDAELEEIVRNGSYSEYLKETDTSRKAIEHFLKIKEEVAGISFAVINNPHDNNLVSSDRPVILLNPFLERKKVQFGKTGLFQMGIVLVMAVSPKTLLVGYDHRIYVKPRRSDLSEEDVKNLNRLSVLSATEGVFSTQIPAQLIAEIPDILNHKVDPRVVTIDLSNDYKLSYHETSLPNLPFSFLEENGLGEKLALRLPYPRQR